MKNATIHIPREKPLVEGVITVRGFKAGTQELIDEIVTKNMIMQGSMTGLDLVIQWAIGQMAPGGAASAYVNGISYGEIGTGTTAPVLADVSLTMPVARAIPMFQQDYGNQQAILQFFFPDASLPNNTYTEFGTYTGGSAVLGSGQIFNHALLSSPYAKVNGQDTTAQVVFSLSQ